MTATATVKEEQVNLDSPGDERIGDLTAERQRLALDSQGDPKARERLVEVERELADLRVEAERVALARMERDRREARATDKAKADELAKVQRARAAAKSQTRKSAAQVDAAILAVYARIADDENVIAREAEFARREAELLGQDGVVRSLYPVGQYQVAFQRLAEPAELYGRLGFEHGTQNPRSLAEQRSES